MLTGIGIVLLVELFAAGIDGTERGIDPLGLAGELSNDVMGLGVAVGAKEPDVLAEFCVVANESSVPLTVECSLEVCAGDLSDEYRVVVLLVVVSDENVSRLVLVKSDTVGSAVNPDIDKGSEEWFPLGMLEMVVESESVPTMLVVVGSPEPGGLETPDPTADEPEGARLVTLTD